MYVEAGRDGTGLEIGMWRRDGTGLEMEAGRDGTGRR